MTNLEIDFYIAMKISKNDIALKNNILDVLIKFETNEDKKALLKYIKEGTQAWKRFYYF